MIAIHPRHTSFGSATTSLLVARHLSLGSLAMAHWLQHAADTGATVLLYQIEQSNVALFDFILIRR
jgi:predicted ABC-class ATPase